MPATQQVMLIPVAYGVLRDSRADILIGHAIGGFRKDRRGIKIQRRLIAQVMLQGRGPYPVIDALAHLRVRGQVPVGIEEMRGGTFLVNQAEARDIGGVGAFTADALNSLVIAQRLVCLLYTSIYVDADNRCLRPISTIVPPNADLVLYQEDLGTIGNDFVAVSREHPVIAYALDLSLIHI